MADSGDMNDTLVQTIENLQQRLKILEDKDALWALMNSYCISCDNHRWQEFAEHYTEDGIMEFETWGAKVGRKAIADAASVEAKFQGVEHSLTNLQFWDVDGGDTAKGTAYLAFYATPDVSKPEVNYAWGGPYRFEFRRTSEGWKVARQHLRKTWAQGVDTTGTFS